MDDEKTSITTRRSKIEREEADVDFINMQLAEAAGEGIPEIAYDARFDRWFFEYVDRITDLYVSYRKKYVVMRYGGMPFIPKDSKGEYKKLDNSAMIMHMNHKLAVSVFAGPYTSKFMCFDVDNGDAEAVHKIIDKMEELGIARDYVYVSTSGNKGYHVEVFFNDLVYTYRMAAFYKLVCKECGLDEKKVEFRPTHGQAIKLPLSIHRVTGNICWYLDRETLEPIESFEYLFQIKQMEKADFVRIFKNKCKTGRYTCSITEKRYDYQEVVEKPEPLPASSLLSSVSIANGWPVLTDAHMRYQTMTAIAVYERYHGAEADDLRDRLADWIDAQPSEFITDPRSVVDYDIRKVVDWVFGPNFRCIPEEKTITFTQTDVSIILSQDTKARRKFMFLARMYEKRYGRFVLSCRRIGEYVGCAEDHVCGRVVPDLVAKGAIKKSTGKWRVVNGNVIRDSNEYQTVNDESCRNIACVKDCVEVRGQITPENFDRVYYGVMVEMVEPRALQERLTKSEIKWIKENGIYG